MKKVTTEEITAELMALARLPDAEIDLSDIPEASPELWVNAERGRFYKPSKDEVADVD